MSVLENEDIASLTKNGSLYLHHDLIHPLLSQITSFSGNNTISSIPSEIGLLTKLEKLFLCECCDTAVVLDNKVLPFYFRNDLISVFVSKCTTDGNQISSVPSEIGLLAKLEKLSLGKCCDKARSSRSNPALILYLPLSQNVL